MEYDEKQFISGFNSGYILSKYESGLITSILRRIEPVNNSFISGMIYGSKQYELEQTASQLDELSKLRDKGLDYEKERGN